MEFLFSEKFVNFLSPVKDEKLGDKIHEFILIPGDVFFFLFILLISNGMFPRLLPKVNLNDGSVAYKKDVWSAIAKIIKKNRDIQ